MLHVRIIILSTMRYARIFITALTLVAFDLATANPLEGRNTAIICASPCAGCECSLIVCSLIHLPINLMARYMPCRYDFRQMIALSKFAYCCSIVQAILAATVGAAVDVTTTVDALVSTLKSHRY